METSTIHQADGGREEEWAESVRDGNDEEGPGRRYRYEPRRLFISLYSCNKSIFSDVGDIIFLCIKSNLR